MQAFPHQAIFHFSVDSDCVSYNSVLKQSTWSQHQIPQVKGSEHKTTPTSDAGCKSQIVSGTSHWFIGYKLGFHSSLFEWLTELRKRAYLLDYQFAIKIQLRNSQIEATRRTRFVGRYTCLLQDHHPQHLHVSTSPEALQTPTLETFMEDSSNRHDQLLTQSLASFPP